MKTCVPWKPAFPLFYWMILFQLAAARRIAWALYSDVALASWLKEHSRFGSHRDHI